MIYAIDVSDRTREPIRQMTVDFFKQHLGFLEKEIIFVNRKEFGQDQNKNKVTRFEANTQMMLNDSAKLIFADKDIHFAKQILNIAFCESQGGNFHAYNYFTVAANFELSVELTAEFT